MTETKITMIPVEMLFPHKDNPRKDLGDLTELSDSIKTNGIMQNLTVIPGHSPTKDEWEHFSKMYSVEPSEEIREKLNSKWYNDGYTVIIGHRRLAASKLAGITEVPCVITDMDEKTQLSTMLLENMQRSDLTVYEQAQGFQMMMDFGSTVSEISEKTGFSVSTIHRRISLLDLDREEFKASQDRGATLSDYVELEKIKDINLKNECLKKIGTKDFNFAVKRAVEKEKTEKCKKEWIALLTSVAQKCDYKERMERTQKASFFMSGIITDFDRERIAKAVEEEKELYWCTDGGYFIYLLGAVRETATDKAQQQHMADMEKRKAAHEKLSALEMNSYELRKEFVKDYSGNKEHLPLLLLELLTTNILGCEDEYISEALGIEIDTGEDGDPVPLTESDVLFDMLSKKPQKVILAYLSDSIESKKMTCHYIYAYKQGEFLENEDLVNWYALLEKCGYQISSEEQQLLDGTHSAYYKPEE